MMKTIKKIPDGEQFLFEEKDFPFSDALVQGAKTAKCGKRMLIESPRRYKLFTDEVNYVKIVKLNGEGHFKWSRGETPFAEGDCFEVDGVGEYELTANGTFLIVR